MNSSQSSIPIIATAGNEDSPSQPQTDTNPRKSRVSVSVPCLDASIAGSPAESIMGDNAEANHNDDSVSYLNETRQDFASTQREVAQGELDKVTQTSANKVADALSLEGRCEGFTPFNPSVHDPAKVLPLIQALKDVAAIPDGDLSSLQAQREMHLFEAENKASTLLHDVLGFQRQSTQAKYSFPPLLEHTDDDNILYCAGRHLAVSSLTAKGKRRVLPAFGDKTTQIHAFAVSTDGKYIALSETRVDSNIVTLYRIDSGATVSTLTTKYIASTPVTCLAISSNNRFLVTVTAAPDHKLVLWHLEDSQVLGMCENLQGTPIDRVAFNGWDSSRLISSSANSVVLWAHKDRALQAVSLLEDTDRHKVPLFAAGQLPSSHALNKLQSTSVSTRKLSRGQSVRQTVVSVLPIKDVSFSGSPFGVGERSTAFSLAMSGVLGRGPIVSTLWFDEESSAALTSDGWLVATEANDTVTYCKRITLPPHAFAGVNTSNPLQTSKCGGDGADAASMCDVSSNNAFNDEPETSLGVTAGGGVGGGQQPPIFTQLAFVSRGLIAATASGMFVLLDRTYDTDVFMQAAVFRCGTAMTMSRLVGLSVSPGEMNLVASTSDNTVYYVKLEALDDAIHEFKMDKEYQAARARDDLDDTAFSALGASVTNGGGSNALLSMIQDGGLVTFSHTASSRSLGLNSFRKPVELPEGCVDLCEGPKWEGLFSKIDTVTFHSSAVTSLSLCIQQSIVATTSTDCSVRIYNYRTHELVATLTLSDPINCCTLHPMGTHIIVAEDFATNVYCILNDGISLLVPLPLRGVLGARYSCSGGRIAFSVGNRVHLYCAASYSPVGMLVGHTNMVKSIRWTQDDHFLVTSDVVGSIMKWDAFTFKREPNECNHRGIASMCAISPDNGATFAAIGSTRHTKSPFMVDGEMTLVSSTVGEGDTPRTVYLRPGFQYPTTARKMHTSPLVFSKLSQTLFVGTPVGKVLLYSWPLYHFSRPYAMLDSHSEEVLHLELSVDEQLLFSVGAEGILFIHSLTHLKGGRHMKIGSFNFDIFSHVFLTDSRARVVVEDTAANGEMQERMELVRSDMELAEQALRRAHERRSAKLAEKTKSICGGIEKEIKATKTKFDQFVAKGQQEGSKQDKMRSDILEGIETSYGRLTLESANRFNALLKEKETLVLQFEKSHASRVNRWEIERGELEKKKAFRERELTEQVDSLRAALKDQEQVRAAVLDLTLLDGEQEVATLKRNHRNQLNYIADNIQTVHQLQISGEREAMRLEQDLQTLQDDLVEKEAVLARLDLSCEAQRTENANLRIQNKLKQDEINATEKRMQHIRQQLHSLENLRFVLTHQLEGLQGEVEPKEAKLVQLDKAVLEREKMLQAVYGSRTRLMSKSELAEAALKRGVTTYSNTMNVHNHKAYDVQSVLADVAKAVELFQGGDGSQLKRELVKLVSANQKRLPATQDRNKADPAVIAKSDNDRALVETEIQSHNRFLSDILKAETAIHRESDKISLSKNASLRQANTAMIDEIRGLQQAGREEAQRLKGLERKLRDARVMLQHLGDERRNLLNEERKSLATERVASVVHPDVPLPPPSTNATLSALSTHNRSKFAIPTTTTVPSGPTSRKRPATLPPLKQSGGEAGSMVVANAGSPSKRSPASAGSMGGGKLTVGKQRAQLESLISQLDSSSDKIRARQVEAHRLRMMVHELLTDEEKRLEVALSDTSAALATHTSATDRFVHLTSGDTPSILRLATESRMSGATRSGMSMYTPGPQDDASGFLSSEDSPPSLPPKKGRAGKRVVVGGALHTTEIDLDLRDPDVEVMATGLNDSVGPAAYAGPNASVRFNGSDVDDNDNAASEGGDAQGARPMTPPTGLPL